MNAPMMGQENQDMQQDDTQQGNPNEGTYTFDIDGEKLQVEGEGKILDKWDQLKAAIEQIYPTAKLEPTETPSAAGEPAMPMMSKGIKGMAGGSVGKQGKKFAFVMKEGMAGKLHSGGSGKIVTNPAQMKAIAFSVSSKLK